MTGLSIVVRASWAGIELVITVDPVRGKLKQFPEPSEIKPNFLKHRAEQVLFKKITFRQQSFIFVFFQSHLSSANSLNNNPNIIVN